jgi:hypothetical protein
VAFEVTRAAADFWRRVAADERVSPGFRDVAQRQAAQPSRG